MGGCYKILTRVFYGSDDQFEPIGVSAPVVGHVLEGDKVAAREERAHLLLRVAAG